MNKKEGASKVKGDNKTKVKAGGKSKDLVKKDAKNDSKSKSKNVGDENKKSSKDPQKRASRSPSKPDTKEKSKSAPPKSDGGLKKAPGDKKSTKKAVNGDGANVKPSSKPKHVKEEQSKVPKGSKEQDPVMRGGRKTTKVDASPSKKSSKTDASHPKRTAKTDSSPKKSSKTELAHNNKTPAKKNKEHDGNEHKKPLEKDHKKAAEHKARDGGEKVKVHDDKKSPSPKHKAKTPTPEPTRKTPTPNYEDDFEVLNPANNPDTHTRRLATAVPRKEYAPPSSTQAKQMWDPAELKKAIDDENQEAEKFDPVEYHKKKKNRNITSPIPTKKQKHDDDKTVSFPPEEEKEAETKASDKPKAVRSINFSSAKKEQQKRKSAQKREGRGRALLSLIELFEQDFDLFELEPASHDQIMASFGKAGMQQATTQTNEDDLTEELQTEEIKMRVKWTQHPIQFDVKVTTNDEGEVVSGPTYYDYMGVGGDMEEDEENAEERRQSSAIRLNKFLGAAGSCMLMLLEEELARTAKTDSASSAGRLKFTSGSARLGEGAAALLAGRPVSHLSFCDTDNKMLVTAHQARAAAAEGGKVAEKSPQKSPESPEKSPHKSPQKSADNAAEKGSGDEGIALEQYGLLCVWSVNEPSQPQKVLVTSAEPTCSCFSPVKPRLVFAGCADGSLDVWDLHESASEHVGLRSAAGAALRSPTYSTAEIHRAAAHTDAVVALRPVPVGVGETVEVGVEPGSFQMCSLDSAGHMVFWVAMSSRHQANLEVLDGDLGLAPWGMVKLVKISQVSVDDFLDPNNQKTFTEVHDFRIHPTDPSHIYVSTDNGTIIHCTRQGVRATPRLFRPEIDLSVPVRCLAFCPMDQPYLLAGSADGTLRLHTTSGDRPLITWNNAADGAPVLAVVWSRSRPCVFFVLDADSKIHVWDLSAGDIFPAETDEVKSGQATAMDLSYGVENDKIVTHLAVSTEAGTIEVHKVSETYTSKTEEESSAEMERFLHYVQII